MTTDHAPLVRLHRYATRAITPTILATTTPTSLALVVLEIGISGVPSWHRPLREFGTAGCAILVVFCDG